MTGYLLPVLKIATFLGVLYLFKVIKPRIRHIGRAGTRIFRRRVVEPWNDRAEEKARLHIRHAVLHLETLVPGVPTRSWSGMVTAVTRWCRYAELTAIWHAVVMGFFAWCLFQIGEVGTVIRYAMNHPPGSNPQAGPGCWMAEHPDATSTEQCRTDELDPLAALWRAIRDLVEWMRDTAVPSASSAVTKPLGDPAGTLTILAVAALVLTLLSALRAALPTFQSLNKSPQNANNPANQWNYRAAPRSRDKPLEERQWRPVVELLSVCGTVGTEYKRQESRRPLECPDITLKAAERVVWTAWRARHGRVRRERRRQLKQHAAQVVGALRAMEDRQYSSADPRKTLEDTAAMLLKIAQRYAEGRTLALLDPADLEDIEEAVNREWMRATAMGVGVTVIATGFLVSDLPEPAATPLIGTLSLLLWMALYGGRIKDSSLIDIMRGQSRT
ncbi:hypothetical protein [Streptomyces sp. ODS28]|uniref:hypothetical protein n=1 Tax=Streptomyces sp. ODS28 TaxID=3136688 RepID=UPI0031F191F8